LTAERFLKNTKIRTFHAKQRVSDGEVSARYCTLDLSDMSHGEHSPKGGEKKRKKIKNNTVMQTFSSLQKTTIYYG